MLQMFISSNNYCVEDSSSGCGILEVHWETHMIIFNLTFHYILMHHWTHALKVKVSPIVHLYFRFISRKEGANRFCPNSHKVWQKIQGLLDMKTTELVYLLLWSSFSFVFLILQTQKRDLLLSPQYIYLIGREKVRSIHLLFILVALLNCLLPCSLRSKRVQWRVNCWRWSRERSL